MGAAVTAIRALQRGDLPAVTQLYETVFRAGMAAKPGLAEEFERTVLDYPWADPGMPSLVYEQPDGAISGFLGSHVRRMRLGSRRVRMGCAGQLVTDPAHARRGIGALLLRRYLSGPQDLTVTDGANDAVRLIWEGLGGSTSAIRSLSWTRRFAPAAMLGDRAARRIGRPLPGTRSAARIADRIAARRLAPPPVTTVSEPLGAEDLLTALDALASVPRSGRARLGPAYELLPDYDRPYLDWLFEELSAVRARGELVGRLVRGHDGTVTGWYVLYSRPGATSQAIQVGAAPARAAAVLDHLFADAAANGSAAVEGRVEPALLPALRERGCSIRGSDWTLMHSDDPDLLAPISLDRALLSRIDGDWWMGHHLPADAPWATGRAGTRRL